MCVCCAYYSLSIPYVTFFSFCLYFCNTNSTNIYYSCYNTTAATHIINTIQSPTNAVEDVCSCWKQRGTDGNTTSDTITTTTTSTSSSTTTTTTTSTNNYNDIASTTIGRIVWTSTLAYCSRIVLRDLKWRDIYE